MVTYWLYYNNGRDLLTSVRAPERSTREEILAKAVESNRRVPLKHEGMNPQDFEEIIERCWVVMQ